ncbi:MAG TPA: ATPase domain-containing protein [Nitrososphaerales archaeon]|nr:ATPase domain-containing protein [Nitrososphaerales archaeon]
MLTSKVRTGIEGFDELVLGGLPRGQSILVTGGTGTGKSTFALQFLYKGAKVYDEPGIYVTLEETIPGVIKNASTYGWDIEGLQKKSKVELLDYSPVVSGQIRRIEPTDIFASISAAWKRIGAKRIVVDPITVFGMQTDSLMQLRQDLLRFSNLLKQLDSTVLFVTEIPEDSQSLSRYGVEEFIADGVIVLYFLKFGGLRARGIEVRKMRGTSHKEGTFPVKISEAGIVVYPSKALPKLG